MNEPLLTIKQVADFLNMSPKSIYRLAQKRLLPGVKVGASWRFTQLRWLSARRDLGHRGPSARANACPPRP
ncbi:MAG: helix-turn-helix domain-containing protein [Planctomycetota bacterium]